MSDFPLYAMSEEHQAVREAVRAVCDAKVAPAAPTVTRKPASRARLGSALVARCGPMPAPGPFQPAACASL